MYRSCLPMRVTGEVRLLGGSELRFGVTVPEGVQQQFRNAFFAARNAH
jgi:hypothetical protein